MEARFCISDWDFIERKSNSRLFRNKHTGKHCEEYLLNLYSEPERLFFETRALNNSLFIVKVLHFESFSNFNAANVFTHYNVRIFIEHVRFRLSEIAELP